jgi:hypothetical protein
MSENMLEPERPQKTIWRRVACLINKPTRAQTHSRARTPTQPHPHPTTHTHTHTQKYVILVAWVREHARSRATVMFIWTTICLVSARNSQKTEFVSVIFRLSTIASASTRRSRRTQPVPIIKSSTLTSTLLFV